MSIRYRVWSEADQEKLKTMAQAGASAQRISVALKRPLSSVKHRARDMGIPFPHDIDLAKQRRRILGT